MKADETVDLLAEKQAVLKVAKMASIQAVRRAVRRVVSSVD